MIVKVIGHLHHHQMLFFVGLLFGERLLLFQLPTVNAIQLEDFNGGSHFAKLVGSLTSWDMHAKVIVSQTLHGVCQSHGRFGDAPRNDDCRDKPKQDSKHPKHLLKLLGSAQIVCRLLPKIDAFSLDVLFNLGRECDHRFGALVQNCVTHGIAILNHFDQSGE